MVIGGEIKAGDDVKFHNDDYDFDHPAADCDNEKLYALVEWKGCLQKARKKEENEEKN